MTKAPARDQRQAQWLFERGILTREALERALAAPGAGADLCERLRQVGWLSAEQAAAARDGAAAASSGGSQLAGETAPPSSSGILGPGARIGPYTLGRKLGEGGMGVVFEAQHATLSRPVALKVVSTAGDGSSIGERVHERFEVEAQVLQRLRHPHIVQVLDVSISAELSYMAMELVAGGTLRARLEAEGALETGEALGLVATLAEGLSYAHRRGLIHRDMKPANVLLREDGSPVITDFGLAKEVAARERGLTQTGDMLGTPGYMAPEQIDPALGWADGRVDIYALGVLLFEALTERLPFEGETTLEVVTQVLHRDPPSPRRLRPELPVDVETILARCLARERERRYETAAALAEDCRRASRGEPVAAEPVGVLERLELRLRRNARGLAVAGAAAAILIIAALLVSQSAREAEVSRVAEEGARQAQQRAEDERARAEAQEALARGARAEAEAALAEADAARRESELKSAQLAASVMTAEENLCQAYLERTRMALEARRWDHAGLFAAEAWERARRLSGERASALRRGAEARLHNALIQSRCLWRIGGPPLRPARLIATATRAPLFVAGDEVALQLWDTRTGLERRTFVHGLRGFGAVALSPSGAWMAVGEGPQLTATPPTGREPPGILVHLYALGSPDEPRRLSGHTAPVIAASVDDEGRVTSVSTAGELLVWEPGEAEPTHRSQLSRSLDSATIASRAPRALIASQGRGEVRETTRDAFLHSVDPPSDTRSILLSPGGDGLARLTLYGELRWQPFGGAERELATPASVVAFRFLESRPALLATLSDGLIVRIGLEGRAGEDVERLGETPQNVTWVGCCDDERVAVMRLEGGAIGLWDFARSGPSWVSPPLAETLSVSSDGRKVLAGAAIRDAQTGQLVERLPAAGLTFLRGPWELLAPTPRGPVLVPKDEVAQRRVLIEASALRCASVAPDGSAIAIATQGAAGRQVEVYDLPSGERRFARPWERVRGLALAGATLAVLGEGLSFWSAATGEVRKTDILGNPLSVALTKDGERVVAGRADGSIYVYDRRGEILRSTPRTGHPVHALAISPDERRFAAGCDDRSAQVWSLEPLRLERSLLGHANLVRAVAWRPDGVGLLSLGGDLRAWELPQPREARRWAGPNAFNPCAASPGGRFIGVYNWKVVGAFPAGETRFARRIELKGKGGAMFVGFESDARAFAFDHETIHLWGLPDWDELATATPPAPLTGLRVGPDERLYAYSGDKVLRGFDARTLEQEWEVAAPIACAFLDADPRTRHLLLFHPEVVGVMDLDTRSLLWQRRSMLERIEYARLRPEDGRVILQTRSGVLHLDLLSGALLQRVTFDGKMRGDLRMDESARFVVGISEEQELSLWDVETGARFPIEVGERLDPQSIGRSFAWSTDDTHLVLCTDKHFRLFDLSDIRAQLRAPLPEDASLLARRLASTALVGFELTRISGCHLEPFDR